MRHVYELTQCWHCCFLLVADVLVGAPTTARAHQATTAVKVIPRVEAQENSRTFFTSLPTHLDDIAEAP